MKELSVTVRGLSRRFVQLVARALSHGIAHFPAAEKGLQASPMIGVPFEKMNPRIALIATCGRGTTTFTTDEISYQQMRQIVALLRQSQERQTCSRGGLKSGQRSLNLTKPWDTMLLKRSGPNDIILYNRVAYNPGGGMPRCYLCNEQLHRCCG